MQPDKASIVVSPESILAHGETIGAIAAEVEVARAAAQTVRLDTGAYGMLCAFVPFVLNKMSDDLMLGLRAAADSLHDTSARLKTVAHEYAAADADAQQRFGEQP